MSNIIILKDSFYDFEDFLKEISDSRYNFKYEEHDNYIQFPDEKSIKNPLAILERRLIIDRHSKTTDEELASMLFRMVIHKDGNFIPYLRKITKNYTIEDYFNKIIELFHNKKTSNYYYVIGSLLEIIKRDNEKLYSKISNTYGTYVENFINSLSMDETYEIYMKRPNIKKYKNITIEDRINYQLMDTCIRISNYYIETTNYELATNYIDKAIEIFPFSYRPYLVKKQIQAILNVDYDLYGIFKNKKFSKAKPDIYGFDNITYQEFVKKINNL